MRDDTEHGSAGRRWRSVALLLLAAGAVLSAGFFWFILAKTSLIAEQIKERVVPVLSERLGVPVAIGDVKARLLPNAHVELGPLVVGAPTEGEPALLRAESASASVELWPLLRSFGRELSLQSLTLEGARLNLVQRRDGGWNYQTLAPSQEQPGRLQSFGIEEVALRDGAVALYTEPTASAGAEPRPDALVEAIDATLTGVGGAAPLQLKVAAALGAEQQNARISASLRPGAGPSGAPALEGQLSLEDVALGRFRDLLPGGAGQLVRSGSASLRAEIDTTEQGYVIEGQGAVQELELRAGPARATFSFTTRAHPERPERLALRIPELRVEGPGIELGGNAAVQTSPLRVQLSVSGPLLDVEQVLANVPPTPDEPPASAPSALSEASVTATLDVERLALGKLEAGDVHANVSLQNGLLRVDSGRAEIFGGQLNIARVEADLREPRPTWRLDAGLSAAKMGDALRELSGRAPVTGRASAQLELSGTGVDWSGLRSSLSGTAALQVADGALAFDFADGALAPLRQALSTLGVEKLTEPLEALEGRRLQRLGAKLVLREGGLVTQQPIGLELPYGSARLSGRVGFDGALDLSGSVQLEPEVLRRLTRGALATELEVPVAIGGTLAQPAVSARVSPEEMLEGLVRSAPRLSADALDTGKLERQVRRQIRSLLPTPD